MGKLILIIFCLTYFYYKPTSSQNLRSPYNFINRQLPEIIDAPRYFNSPNVITDPPANSIVPLPGSSPTTIITDCSPTVCKNLANTIQLMIVCNLLQNTKGGTDIAMQLAGPILNEVMSSPVLSCGCSNPIPNLITPNVITPNVITPNVITPNVITPNILNSILNPNVIQSPKFISSNLMSSPVVSTIPTSPISTISPINNLDCGNNGLLTSILSLLGNRIQM